MYHLIISLYENYTKLMKIIKKQDCKYRTSRIINSSSFISPLSLCYVSTNNVPLCMVKSVLSQHDERIFIFLLLSDNNIFYPHSIYIYIFRDAPFNNVLILLFEDLESKMQNSGRQKHIVWRKSDLLKNTAQREILSEISHICYDSFRCWIPLSLLRLSDDHRDISL